MSADYLDLDHHTIEEAPGKLLTLHGAEYVVQDLLAEGGESFVFRIQHRLSGYSWFVAKVAKWRPGSERYEYLKNIVPVVVFAAHSQLDDQFRIFEPQESYEIAGGLIRIQRFLGDAESEVEPALHRELCDQAMQFMDVEAYDSALTILDQVLKLNPYHTVAMVNKAGCLIGIGEPAAALKLLEYALTIEPNTNESYLQAGRAYLDLGYPGDAIAILDRTLDRYRLDFQVWKRKGLIAARHNLPKVLQSMIAELDQLFADPTAVGSFREELESALVQAEANVAHAHRAIELQKQEMWGKARDEWDPVVKSSDDLEGRLNLCICRYHLGEREELLGELLGLAKMPGVEPSGYACVGLALLCAHESGKLDLAKALALWLEGETEEPWELPGVPVVISDQIIIDDGSSQAYVKALEEMCEGAGCTEPEERAIRTLIERYGERTFPE
jgi:tetratricopeptide (TPR) repeat protein